MWRAFILYTHPLFARGLESLLVAQKRLILSGMAQLGDDGLRQIKALRPEVIIVESDPGESESEQLVASFMREQPETTMVRLNLENNTVILYSGRRCAADSVEDLLDCVVSSLSAHAGR